MKYIVLIISLLCYKYSFSQNTLRYKLTGTVTNSIDGKPMQGANVIVAETGYGTNTDEKGMYRLNPRTAYYILQKVHQINPFTNAKSLNEIKYQFDKIKIIDAAKKAENTD